MLELRITTLLMCVCMSGCMCQTVQLQEDNRILQVRYQQLTREADLDEARLREVLADRSSWHASCNRSDNLTDPFVFPSPLDMSSNADYDAE